MHKHHLVLLILLCTSYTSNLGNLKIQKNVSFVEGDSAPSLTLRDFADVVTFLPETTFHTQIAIRALCSLEAHSQLLCFLRWG